MKYSLIILVTILHFGKIQVCQCSSTTKTDSQDSISKELSCDYNDTVTWNYTNPSDQTVTLNEDSTNITVTDLGVYECYGSDDKLIKTFTHSSISKPEIKVRLVY